MSQLAPLVLLFVVSAFTFGTMAAWLASERGRRPLVWVIVGALTGPLALLLIGFAPMRADNGKYKLCVECVEPIDPEAITCPHCTADQVYSPGT